MEPFRLVKARLKLAAAIIPVHYQDLMTFLIQI